MRSRWVWALARLQAAMVLLQAVFAGGFLSGRAGLLKAHGVNAGLLWLVSIAMIVVCIGAWRGGRSPGWSPRRPGPSGSHWRSRSHRASPDCCGSTFPSAW